MSERPILFVGDIQGCARELTALLKEAGFQAGKHRLIPVGDTINRGPDATGVIQVLKEHYAEPIQGNHERSLLEVIERGESPDWLKVGSAHAQLEESGGLEEAAEWIRTWPLFRQGEDWTAVHAGVHPISPLEETDPVYLTKVRYCDPNGERPPFTDSKLADPPNGFLPWYEYYEGSKTVIYGHWARRGLNLRTNVRGLDTGCVYGGHLTGLWWPADKLVEVNSAQPHRRLPVFKS